RARVDGVIALSPRLAEARAERAQLALDAGKPGEAIDAALYALGINSRYGRAHYLLSQAYARTGNERGAATHAALFERYRQLAPRSNDAVMREVNQLNESEQSLLQAALDYHAGGRADLAITAFNEMMETQPDSAGPHINLIAMHGQRGDFEAAEQHIEAALALNPESIELHDNIGVLRLRQGRRDEAIAHFEQAHELDPQYSRPLKNLGALYLANDDHQLGVDYLERALELEPTDIQTRYLLGKGLLDMRQAERAVEILKPLSRVPRPESALHLQTLGRAQIANGEIGDAIASLTEAQRQAQLRGLEGVSLEIANDLVRARAAL
ncbi:MAG: tetratricopeptide repeat protein, partial [Gammaproteobacteria bacterium]|nr:tetratricopeptide repeat protein [Gammaproteobacteria bacterium]